ncbi:MAG: hypothetical protein FJ403_09835 [Verrucomicrobia bacterium]|nr:hypothetical protein [Verrucomicrobiota bacterium]
MPVIANPALAAFVAQLGDEQVFAQLLIRRQPAGYELRHIADCGRPSADLKEVRLEQLRALAQFTAQGAFRPLKSAPDLQTGWRAVLHTAGELERALDHLYPGAIPNWHAALSATPPVTNYREFTERQTGMYRITQKLTDAQVAGVVDAACSNTVCLKRRLWTVTGMLPDFAREKSLIPCLEPCALFLEHARKAMRREQREEARLSSEIPEQPDSEKPRHSTQPHL